MLLLHHLPREAGMPLLGAVRGQGHFGEQVKNGEKHLQACGQVIGQLCLLKQQVADLFPATSRRAWQEVNVLPQERRSGQAAPASTLCMPCTLRREPECHFLDQAKKGCLCHLSATRTRLSGTDRPHSHQQLPPLAISKANGGFHLTHHARASNPARATMVTSHTPSTPSYPQQRSLPTFPTCNHVKEQDDSKQKKKQK